ncbi:ABC transporter ATP-binding protein YtrB [Roseimaritima multifibrata]|uniref:ABC transporter ATP-binding protein YtrB n=1 Tax=Roseimaritima multifibrata TaxID=1930274 RepID=A0A517MCD6_9BACT|nr:ABC transporter ATP-binding protein [Roseimaritima multifibrata]QDS92550.1 ABC transporter ATP-binding protein YtrB [Roseimaritima multifibrata]
MNAVISVSQVKKGFRGCDALRGVNLEVPPGVVFALLGENGAGKTTLIRILTGFLEADSGEAQILGMDCRAQSLEIRRRIGYVSDAPALYDWMTPERIGWFTASFYPPGFQARYEQLLRQFEVPAGRKIRHMSKGQRAKVALALAVAHEPDLLILDEPTSGLDPLVRRQFLESMVDRAATGRTVLLSSHQIDEVERVADWIAIMRDGVITLVEPLQELKEATQQVLISLTDPLVEFPMPNGRILNQTANGRQRQLVVHRLDPDSLQVLRNTSGVQNVEIRTPTLEEIFIACTRGDSQPIPAEASTGT